MKAALLVLLLAADHPNAAIKTSGAAGPSPTPTTSPTPSPTPGGAATPAPPTTSTPAATPKATPKAAASKKSAKVTPLSVPPKRSSATLNDTAAARRVAVVVLGPDALTAGELQREVEERLSALAGVVAVTTDASAEAKAAESYSGFDPRTDGDVSRLLDEARGAYAEKEYARALDRLSAATTLRGRFSGGPLREERVQILLLRAAAFLRLGAELDAEAEATEALMLVPDLRVDGPAFADEPALAAMIKGLKTKLPGASTVIVDNLPAGAQLWVDGRTVARVFRVLKGEHTLRVAAPGRRGWEKKLMVDGNTVLRPGLVLSLSDDVEKRLTDAIWWGSLAADDDVALEALFHRTQADWLLVVATKPGPQPVARAMLVPAKRDFSVLHGGTMGIDSAAPIRIAEMATMTARPDAWLGDLLPQKE